MWMTNTLCTLANEDLGTLVEYDPLTGQAADAVSGHTQVRMENAPKLLKNSKMGMSRDLDSSTTTHMA